MAVDEATVRERLSKVFARQDFFEACKRRDAGAIVRILGAHGITDGAHLGTMTGLAQSTLSNYKRGVHQAEFASVFEKIADGLDMPQRLRQALGLIGESSPIRPVVATGVAGVPADTFDLIQLAEVVGRNGTNVKRREMLSLAAALGGSAALAQSEVWERLAYALTNSTSTNDAVVREMEARSAGFHRLEEIVSAPLSRPCRLLPSRRVRCSLRQLLVGACEVRSAPQGPYGATQGSDHASQRNGQRSENYISERLHGMGG